MAKREIRTSRVFNMAVGDIRRQSETVRKEVEEEWRTKTKTVVLKESESRRGDRQQLLDEMKNFQVKLSVTERENRKLKAELQRAKEQIGWRDHEITDLHRHICALEKKYKATNDECVKAEESIKKRDKEIISLQRETERMRTTIEKLKHSSGLKTIEESWQREIGQLKELLVEKDKEVSRANHKRRARTNAHVDTLALLSDTQSALKQTKLTCQALEEKLLKQLADKEESHRKELAEREECFRQQLSETVETSRHELSKLSESWETRVQRWEKKKRELEEMMCVKEKIWKHEEANMKEDNECFRRENIRLQKLMMEKTEKQSVWSWWVSE